MGTSDKGQGQNSMLSRGASSRILLALGVSALLWAGVLWALG